MVRKGAFFLPHQRLNDLILGLQRAGYQCIGPQEKDGAIVYDQLTHAEQLPWGIQDIQLPGKYHLKKTSKKKAFAWVNGPEAVKPLLFKPREILWQAKRNKKGEIAFVESKEKAEPIAIFGIRPCDLAAMLIQDKVFMGDGFVDQAYKQRREKLFVVVANCTRISPNCFCVSAGGSTKATQDYDIALTEISNGFVVEVGSDKARVIIEKLKLGNASIIQRINADERTKKAAKKQNKKLPKGNLKEKLFAELDHDHYENVAKRCLSCGNCTLVCPTCFCHSEYDDPKLDGLSTDHLRQWDSCFTNGHSYIVGNVIRKDTKSRYRQWLTHKLGSWYDQFGTSGCVGCGRCITWCPVGIDITEEANIICSTKKRK